MNKKNIFIFASGIFFLISCTVTKPMTSKVLPGEINDLQKFEPFSYITLIEKGNKGKINDTISNISKITFTSALLTFKEKIPVKGDISISDTITQRKIEMEVGYLFISAERKRSISDLKITPTLDSILDANDKRFGLITVTTGFTRTRSNYSGQVAKGAAMAILSLGSYYQTPVKANSTIYIMIVDAKENNITFFKKSFLQEKEPIDEAVLKKQIK